MKTACSQDARAQSNAVDMMATRLGQYPRRPSAAIWKACMNSTRPTAGSSPGDGVGRRQCCEERRGGWFANRPRSDLAARSTPSSSATLLDLPKSISRARELLVVPARLRRSSTTRLSPGRRHLARRSIPGSFATGRRARARVRAARMSPISTGSACQPARLANHLERRGGDAFVASPEGAPASRSLSEPGYALQRQNAAAEPRRSRLSPHSSLVDAGAWQHKGSAAVESSASSSNVGRHGTLLSIVEEESK